MNDATMELGSVARATLRKLAEEELARLFDGSGDPPIRATSADIDGYVPRFHLVRTIAEAAETGMVPLDDMGVLGAMERLRDELVAEVDGDRADILLVREHSIHGWGAGEPEARDRIAEYETHLAQLRDIIVASIAYLRARRYHEHVAEQTVAEQTAVSGGRA